jgi:hypothetical protein
LDSSLPMVVWVTVWIVAVRVPVFPTNATTYFPLEGSGGFRDIERFDRRW